MKSHESPFYLRRLECPVCTTVNDFETIRMGAYTEEGRDTDFRPTGRHWGNPKYTNVNPLLYFMGTCASCFYTREFNNQYREWKSDTTFRTYRQKTVRQKHLTGLAEADGPLRRLGNSLWPKSYPTETAINKLMLGIMDELMLEEPSQSDLARWYLRIAWLFRENTSGDVPQTSPRELTRQELFRTVDKVKKGTDELGRHLDALTAVLDAHPECAARTPDDADGPVTCRGKVQVLGSHFAALVGGIDDLTQWLVDDANPIVGETVESNGTAYGEYPSYAAFLEALKNQWSLAPQNEQEALRFALTHYRNTYESGHEPDSGNAQIQVAYLIGELARRLGDSEVAVEYLNTAAHLGRDWIHKMGNDRNQTALARRIVDLSVEQIRATRETARAEA
ncbi:MAG TPA: DUF2225 domain-containing protein [Acidobacteriota bacterium]|nr:DUF2225 domain-containing protein [Acidobacteriota bacterium]